MRETYLCSLIVTLPSLILAFLVESVDSISQPSLKSKVSFGKTMRSKVVFAASLACGSFFFIFQSTITFYPIHMLQEYHADPSWVATVFSLMFFSSMIARFLAVTLLDPRIGEKKLMVASLIVSTSVALLPLTKSLEQSAVILMLTGVAQGIIYPMGAMMIAKSTSSLELGTANSIYLLFINLSMMSPVLMGLAAEVWGVAVLFPILAIASFVGLISSKYMP